MICGPVAEFIRHEHKLLAVLAVVGGLGTAAGILLIATGRQKEAYAIATTGAILGGSVAAVKLLGRDSSS